VVAVDEAPTRYSPTGTTRKYGPGRESTTQSLARPLVAGADGEDDTGRAVSPAGRDTVPRR
jgi:hypothetical protein